MSVSIVQKLAASFTDTTLPKLYRDPTINAGSKYCFDFTNPYCNPLADGVLANGATMNNLVENAVSAIATVGGSNTKLSNAENKAGLVIGSGTGTLQFGSAGQYDRSVLNHEFLFIIWMKVPASGFVTSYPGIFYQGAGGNRNNEQIWMDMGADGLTPTLTIGGTPSGQVSGSAAVTAGSVFQFAVHWTPGVSAEAYLNGVLKATNVTTIAALLSASTVPLGFNAPAARLGTIYRVYEEDMYVTRQSLPSVTAAQLVAADYATFNGKFA